MELTDQAIKELLMHRAMSAVQEMDDPTTPENQKWLKDLLNTPPDKVRTLLQA
jgi:hypothetical protein